MEKFFRTKQGNKVDIVTHTLEQLKLWPSLKMYVGTDSQDDGPDTTYATAIVYRYGNRGAHVIFFKENISRVRDIFTRLYNEGTRTIETAKIIAEEIPSIKFEALEFDYADVEKTLSTPVVSALRGWVQGLGFKYSFKSGEQLATKAADHIARHSNI